MQDFAKLFYPPDPLEADNSASKIPISRLSRESHHQKTPSLDTAQNDKLFECGPFDIRVTQNHQQHVLREQKELSNSQVLLQEGLTRGRTLGNNQSQSQRKKNILVIKKESINRQNSFSKSPKNQIFSDNANDNSFGSPYQSPKTTEQLQFNYKLVNSDGSSNKQPLPQLPELSQSESGTQMKNSVIIRKTIGELKRAQLNVFYFDSNLMNSAGPGSQANLALNNEKHLNNKQYLSSTSATKQDSKQNNFEQVKKFEINGRNVMTSNYQQFIQRTDAKQIQMSKTFDKHAVPRKSLPNYETDNILLKKFDQNVNQREILRERLEQSSESDDFERQSSNAISVENFSIKGGPKKIVIQKERVNFRNNNAPEFDHHQSSINSQHDQASNGSGQIKKIRKSMLALGEQRNSELEKLLDIQIQIATFSQSPDGLRRQKSDNMLGVSNFKKHSLNHERSQNHLSLHTSNKLEVPKVLKAMPNTNFEELLRSPSSLYTSTMRESTTKKDEIVNNIRPSQREIQIATNKLAKSRQSNIFQMRRSQTFLKERNQLHQQAKQDHYGQQIINESKAQRKSPQKQVNNINIVKSTNHEVSRVSQSLLLDNFYSKSRERSASNRNADSLSKRNETSTKSSELINSANTSHKTSPDMNYQRQSIIISQNHQNDQMTVPQFLTYGRKSTLSQSLNRLIDENRCNSPVRVQQYLVDVDYIKAIAEERINKANQTTSRENIQEKGPISIYNPIDQTSKEISNKLQHQSAMMQTSNSNNAIMSLSSVNTKEKFKEIIDNLYVPTASVFKKKTKEKEFRRPTQNPIRRSKSQHRNQQSTKAQKNKEFEDKLKDIYPQNQQSNAYPEILNPK